MPAALDLSRATKSRLCLAALCVAVVDGVARELFAPDQWFYWGDLVTLLPIGAIIYRWYHLDTEERAYPRSRGLDAAVILVGGFALPYYFVRSRGYRRGAIAILGLGAVCAVYLVLQSAGRLAADHALAHPLARSAAHVAGG